MKRITMFLLFLLALIVASAGTARANGCDTTYKVIVYAIDSAAFAPAGLKVTANFDGGGSNTTYEHDLDGNTSRYPRPGGNPLLSGATVGGVFVPIGTAQCVPVDDNQDPARSHCICVRVYIDVDGCPTIHLMPCNLDPACQHCAQTLSTR